ncbi:MAG TPA: hypothetical protein VF158_16520 [Longimicrobiales bacterium]
MKWWRAWTPANRLAAAAVAGAAAIFVAAAWDAWRIEAPPTLPSPGPVASLPLPRGAAPARSEQAIAAVVARDPFRRDRRRPPERYRPPGRRVAAAVGTALAAPPRLPVLRLLGTASYEDGRGLAAVASGGDLRILRVGETLDGLALLRVDRGTATLAGRDTTIILRLRERP